MGDEELHWESLLPLGASLRSFFFITIIIIIIVITIFVTIIISEIHIIIVLYFASNIKLFFSQTLGFTFSLPDSPPPGVGQGGVWGYTGTREGEAAGVPGYTGTSEGGAAGSGVTPGRGKVERPGSQFAPG